MKFIQRNTPYIIAIAAGFLTLHLRLDISVINPKNLQWLMKKGSDWISHYYGWAFYRDLDWAFPLGKLEDYYYPFVSSIGYTDSIPLMAVPLKLFSDFLSDDFQYIGIWMLSCFILQGIFGIKWMKALGVKNQLHLTVAGLFFIIAPILEFRLMHPALSAHWLVIASLYSYSRTGDLKKIVGFQLLLLFLSAWVHPYMTFMVLALTACVFVKTSFIDNKSLWKEFIISSALAGFLVFISWYAIGYFTLGLESNATDDFGYYCANLNTFFNPMKVFNTDASRFLSPLPSAGNGEYEGFGYLGLGMIVLLGIRTVLWFTHRGESKFRPYLPLIIMASLLLILSFSDAWRINDVQLFDLNIGGFVGKILNTFRSSGRFLWPFYYGMMAWALAGILKNTILNEKWTSVLIVCFLIFQFVDVTPNEPKRFLKHYPKVKYESPLKLSHLDPLCEQADKIMTVPLYHENIVHDGDYIHWMYLAKKHNLAIVQGFYARVDYNKVIELQWQVPDSIYRGVYDVSNEIFVIKEENGIYFTDYVKDGRLDGAMLGEYQVLWDSQMTGDLESNVKVRELSEFITENKEKTIILSVKDDATTKLDETTKEVLRNMDSSIDSLNYRDSYVSIIHHGKIIQEEMSSDSIQWNLNVGDKINGLEIIKDLSIHSAGNKSGNKSSIIINGNEKSQNQRGLNLVVLNNKFEIEKVEYFDTYMSSGKLEFGKVD